MIACLKRVLYFLRRVSKIKKFLEEFLSIVKFYRQLGLFRCSRDSMHVFQRHWTRQCWPTKAKLQGETLRNDRNGELLLRLLLLVWYNRQKRFCKPNCTSTECQGGDTPADCFFSLSAWILFRKTPQKLR